MTTSVTIKTVFHNTTPYLQDQDYSVQDQDQDQDQDRFFWSHIGLVLYDRRSQTTSLNIGFKVKGQLAGDGGILWRLPPAQLVSMFYLYVISLTLTLFCGISALGGGKRSTECHSNDTMFKTASIEHYKITTQWQRQCLRTVQCGSIYLGRKQLISSLLQHSVTEKAKFSIAEVRGGGYVSALMCSSTNFDEMFLRDGMCE